jgi:hypothetical protein
MNDDDKYMWTLFFGQVAGIQYHPANPKDQRASLNEIADIADEMLKIAKERIQCL